MKSWKVVLYHFTNLLQSHPSTTYSTYRMVHSQSSLLKKKHQLLIVGLYVYIRIMQLIENAWATYIYDKIIGHVHKYISYLQFGFLKNRSVIQLLIAIIIKSIGKPVAMVSTLFGCIYQQNPSQLWYNYYISTYCGLF